MNSKLEGKTLLLLGGVNHTIDIIAAAQEMGIRVIVTDYNTGTPAKKLADKAFEVSTTDIPGLKKLCREEHVDGVITGFIDSMLPYCAQLCRELSLPFWATDEQMRLCNDKNYFKECCRKYGVPVIDEYEAECDADGNHAIFPPDIVFPVLVKPADNSGSRGVFVCRDIAELQNNYAEAKTFSKSGRVIIEEYETGQHVNMYYTLSDGEVFLTAMADRFVDQLEGTTAPLPKLLIHPSKSIDEFRETTDARIRDMFKALGMRNGVVFVQGFRRNDGSFVVYEMGYRLNGGATYSLINSCTGYDQMKSLIEFSITGSMGELDKLFKIDPKFSKLAVNYVFSARSVGRIAEIKGLDTVRELDGVVHVTQVKYPGDMIPEGGGSGPIIAYILFTAPDMEGLEKTAVEIERLVHAEVESD